MFVVVAVIFLFSLQCYIDTHTYTYSRIHTSTYTSQKTNTHTQITSTQLWRLKMLTPKLLWQTQDRTDSQADSLPMQQLSVTVYMCLLVWLCKCSCNRKGARTLFPTTKYDCEQMTDCVCVFSVWIGGAPTSQPSPLKSHSQGLWSNCCPGYGIAHSL